MDLMKSGGTSGIKPVVRAVDSDAVYTLQGVKIAARSQWDALPRGIYIVGRRKIVK